MTTPKQSREQAKKLMGLTGKDRADYLLKIGAYTQEQYVDACVSMGVKPTSKLKRALS